MAVHGALPLLRKASAVSVVTVAGDRSEPATPGPELVSYLASHGIDAVADTVDKAGAATGECLINHAREWGAELLVAGAYGHARLREFILGGVTRLLTEQTQLPVLLAH